MVDVIDSNSQFHAAELSTSYPDAVIGAEKTIVPVSPIAVLNNDTTFLIFNYFVDQWVTDHLTSDALVLPAVYILGGVCRFWRKVVYTNRRLWRSVIIWFKISKWYTHRGLLLEWFQRSGNTNLHIYIKALEDATFSNPPQSLYDLLDDVSGRLTTFSCITNTPVWQKFVPQNLPRLTKFALTMGPGSVCNIADAPLLRHVAIDGLREGFTVNWGQLKRVDCVAYNLPKVIPMLKGLRDITELALCLEAPESALAVEHYQCDAFPNLVKATFQISPDAANTLFRVLSLPCLENLSLSLELGADGINHSGDAWVDALIDMFVRSNSSASLKRFEISRADTTEERFIDILQEIPRVLELVVQRPTFNVTNITIDAMKADNRNLDLCVLPSVEKVKFEYVYIRFSGSRLLEMLENRKDWQTDTSSYREDFHRDPPNVSRIRRMRVTFLNNLQHTDVDSEPGPTFD